MFFGKGDRAWNAKVRDTLQTEPLGESKRPTTFTGSTRRKTSWTIIPGRTVQRGLSKRMRALSLLRGEKNGPP